MVHQINVETFKSIIQSRRKLTLTRPERNELWRILREINRSD